MTTTTYTEESLMEELAAANCRIQNTMLDTAGKIKEAQQRGMFLPVLLNAIAGTMWVQEISPKEYPQIQQALVDLSIKHHFCFST
jgi:hypothetical protein